MPTPHNTALPGQIAKTVLMPGDPLRAKFIAETYLENVVQVNSVRNMYGFTGTYHGKPVTIFGSGMGMPSIGIYSYELFAFYGVENIIRIGSCGSYTTDCPLYSVVLVDSAWSESSFAKTLVNDDSDVQLPSAELTARLQAAADKLNIPVTAGRVHSCDCFYRDHEKSPNKAVDNGCIVTEMESFALFANAKLLGKNAACLLTVSDSLVTHEETTAEERQTSFTKMMEIALEMAE